MEWKILISEEIAESSECMEYLKESYIFELLELSTLLPEKEAIETLKRKFQIASKNFEVFFIDKEFPKEIPSEITSFLESQKKFLCPVSLIIKSFKNSPYMILFRETQKNCILIVSELDCSSVSLGLNHANKKLVIIHINQLIKEGKNFAVFSIDIEDFAKINDLYGLKAGDKILEETLTRLKNALESENCRIFRSYSDKFIVVCVVNEGENIWHKFKVVSKKILDIFKEPFDVSGEKVYIIPNIGVSFYPQHGENVLVKADLAQREAFLRKVPILIFSDELNVSKKVVETLAKVREDLKHNRITIYLQPKVDLDTGKIIGAEALMRCSVPPAEAIPVITEYGLLFDVGEAILKKSFNVIRKLERLNVRIPISVNISYSQLVDKRFIPLLDDLIKEYRINPEMLVFELTETEATKSTESLTETLKEIRNRGIKLSIDDFGTGYSSLARLKLLEAWEIKIDKSFVLNIDRNTKDKSIVKFIIDIGKLLSMEVVAEGIERQEQVDILKELGCHKGQGFLFYPPLPVDEFFSLVTESSNLP